MQLCVCPSLLSRFIGELASHGGKREHALDHGFKSIVFQRSTGCTQPYDVDVFQSSPSKYRKPATPGFHRYNIICCPLFRYTRCALLVKSHEYCGYSGTTASCRANHFYFFQRIPPLQ